MAFITVRAVGRSFRFTPTRQVREILWFCLAAVMAEYDLLLHEFEWLSNHFHLLVTDVNGQLPDFVRDLNSLISRSLNAHRGHRGTNIEKGYNVVVPQDEQKVVDHAVYTLANACSSGLARRTKQWKGISSLRMRYGEPIVVKRPKAGLWKYDTGGVDKPARKGRRRKSPKREKRRKPTKYPEAVELVLTRPAVKPQLSDDELRREILDALEARELELIEERRASGKAVIGMKKILSQHWEASPRTREDMFGTVPSVSGRSKWARIEALQRRGAFLADYAAARDAFNAGARDVEFPCGTWLMRRRHNVRCRPPPT